MKLTIIELKTIMRELCTATPLFKKLQKELYKKQSKEKIKKYKENIEIANAAFKNINDMVSFEEGTLSDLVDEDRYVYVLTFEKGKLINSEFKKI